MSLNRFFNPYSVVYERIGSTGTMNVMDSQSQHSKRVKSFFDCRGESFDSIYRKDEKGRLIGNWIDKHFRRNIHFRFEETLKHISDKNIRSIIDVGCGPGRYCVEYLRMGKKVVGIDLSAEMLTIAERACKRVTRDGNIRFVNANYLDHEFDERFDVAVLMGLFDYIEDARSMLKKLKRDVKTLILASFPKRHGILAVQRKIRYQLRNCPLYLYSKDNLEDLLNKTNLTQYDVTDFDREFYVKILLS